jgi:hypothetical protein
MCPGNFRFSGNSVNKERTEEIMSLDRSKFILATDTIEAKFHDYFGADKFRFEAKRIYDAAGRHGGNFKYTFNVSLLENTGERYFGELTMNADNLDPEFYLVAGNLDPSWFAKDENNTRWLGLRTLLLDSVREIFPNFKFGYRKESV